MSNLSKFIFAILFITGLYACQRADMDCIDVEYGVAFTIEKPYKFCFPDSNYFVVKELINGFCPCNANCVWEGEMYLIYEAKFDGIYYEDTIGSSLLTDSVFTKEPYVMTFDNIILKRPCSETVPNPDIESADVVLRR